MVGCIGQLPLWHKQCRPCRLLLCTRCCTLPCVVVPHCSPPLLPLRVCPCLKAKSRPLSSLVQLPLATCLPRLGRQTHSAHRRSFVSPSILTMPLGQVIRAIVSPEPPFPITIPTQETSASRGPPLSVSSHRTAPFFLIIEHYRILRSAMVVPHPRLLPLHRL
jgi:hypothetical protein